MPDPALIERLQAARTKAAEAERARVILETREESFRAALVDFTDQLRAQGIDPTKLDEHVESLEAELKEQVEQLEVALSG